MVSYTDAWGWPQWILFILLFLTLSLHIMKNGKDRLPYNGIGAMLDVSFIMFLLLSGGFFS